MWVSQEVRRGDQGASCVAPGKSGLDANGEGERFIALETWSGNQASSRGEAKDSALLLSCNGYLLEPTEWPKASQASCEV